MYTHNGHNGQKLLIGKDAILDYCQISKRIWPQFVELGLPVAIINQRFYAHTDNIDNFFRQITNKRIGHIPPDVE
jgi:hypothetical protein